MNLSGRFRSRRPTRYRPRSALVLTARQETDQAEELIAEPDRLLKAALGDANGQPEFLGLLAVQLVELHLELPADDGKSTPHAPEFGIQLGTYLVTALPDPLRRY